MLLHMPLLKLLRTMVIILALACTFAVLSIAQAKSFTNSDSASVSTTTVTRSVIVKASDFPDGSRITDVNISITFGHTHTSPCSNRISTGVYDEVFYYLEAPDGTTVNLVNAGDYDFNGGPSVTVLFDDDASSTVGGVPMSGSYQPVGALANYNGKNPIGTWTLYVGDTNGNGTHCFDSFTLNIATKGNISSGVGNDPDKDGISTGSDNCPFHFNPDQEDGWGSEAGDACDTDWYNVSGIGISGFVQKNGIFHLHGKCTFLADGAPRCPVIAALNPSLFAPESSPADITTEDAGDWSVWLHYLHSNNGYDVYQVNIYGSNPPQPGTLLDDNLEIFVMSGSWKWYHRGGLAQYQGGNYDFADKDGQQTVHQPDSTLGQSVTTSNNLNCQTTRLSWISCAQNPAHN